MIELLHIFQQKFSEKLQHFFSPELTHAHNIHFSAHEIANSVEQFTLQGGKRIRPALFYYGYQCFSDQQLDQVMLAAIAFELMQSFLLIHDDIIDNANLRRGEKTLNAKYGNTHALLAGDMSGYLGLLAINQTTFSDQQKSALMAEYARVAIDEVYGQTLDMTPLDFDQLTEEFIYKIYEYKTARYTTELPLVSAAILAKQDEKVIQQFKRIGHWLGILFQIQDDILGIYGDETATGKSISSDITQGKKTLLIYYAWQRANTKQKEYLKKFYGNALITYSEIHAIKDIIEQTNSLVSIKNIFQELAEKISHALNQPRLSSIGKNFIADTTTYVTERTF